MMYVLGMGVSLWHCMPYMIAKCHSRRRGRVRVHLTCESQNTCPYYNYWGKLAFALLCRLNGARTAVVHDIWWTSSPLHLQSHTYCQYIYSAISGSATPVQAYSIYMPVLVIYLVNAIHTVCEQLAWSCVLCWVRSKSTTATNHRFITNSRRSVFEFVVKNKCVFAANGNPNLDPNRNEVT